MYSGEDDIVKYVKLGRTGEQVSRVGLGGMAFGGVYGPFDRNEARRTIEYAIETGVTIFDTSPTYGDGLGEEVLGEALQYCGKPVKIVTKLGTGNVSDFGIWRNNDRESITRRIESSVKRLRRDVLDFYMIYGPDPHTPIGETMEALQLQKETGTIGFIGWCGTSAAELRNLLRYGRIDVVGCSYNMLNRRIEAELIRLCRATRIGILACEPFFRGMLHGRMHRNSVFDITDQRVQDLRYRGQRFRDNIEVVNRLRALAEQEGMTMTELSLAWLQQNPAISVVLCGARSAGQWKEIMRASEATLLKDEMHLIDQIVGQEICEEPA